MDWSVFFAVILGGLTTRVYMFAKSRFLQPYRWKCPECDFKMAMSKESPVLTSIQQEHILNHHKGAIK